MFVWKGENNRKRAGVGAFKKNKVLPFSCCCRRPFTRLEIEKKAVLGLMDPDGGPPFLTSFLTGFDNISDGGVVACLGSTRPDPIAPLWQRDRSIFWRPNGKIEFQKQLSLWQLKLLIFISSIANLCSSSHERFLYLQLCNCVEQFTLAICTRRRVRAFLYGQFGAHVGNN